MTHEYDEQDDRISDDIRINDALAKEIVSNKRVLQMILREAEPRYMGMDTDDIEQMLDDRPDCANLLSIDKEIILNGHIMQVADMCFLVNTPDGQKLLVNVEVQKSANEGIRALGIRMFNTVAYSTAEKRLMQRKEAIGIDTEAISVWIVAEPKKKYRNTVRRFTLMDEEHRVLEGRLSPVLVVFNLAEDWENTEGALRALDLLIVAEASEQRAAELKKLNIDIPLITRGDKDMYSYGESLIEYGEAKGRKIGRREGIQEGRLEGIQEGRLEGIQEGKLEGIQEGRLEGRLEGIYDSISKLISKGYSFDDAFDMIADPEMDREAVREHMSSSSA